MWRGSAGFWSAGVGVGGGWEGGRTILLCLARWARGIRGEILPLGLWLLLNARGENLGWDGLFCLSPAISMSISVLGLSGEQG